MTNLKRTVVLGEGQLNWPKRERQPDRYQSVILHQEGRHAYASFDHAPVGQHARLVLVALKADNRKDEAPPPGTEVELGVGTVFTDMIPDRIGSVPIPVVGVEPADGRPGSWLSMHALYDSSHQTVRLEARPPQ